MANPGDVEVSKIPTAWDCFLLFLGLLLIYHLNGDTYPFRDNDLNLLVAESLIHDGDLAFAPRETADLLAWTYRTGNAEHPVKIPRLDAALEAEMRAGRLHCSTDAPAMTAIHRGTRPDEFVSVFPPGTAITVAPWLWLTERIYGRLDVQPLRAIYLQKFVAACCVAGSAVFIYLTARARTARAYAMLIALCYGLGTCVWPISSQSLWQHGPNELYLSAGIWALMHPVRQPIHVIVAALAFSCATWCRLTSAIFAIAGLALLRTRRERVQYVCIGLPFALGLAAYHWRYFGAPWATGEAMVAMDAQYTGTSMIWGTPLLKGAAGLLISPSRGLFVHSPFLLWAMVGTWRSFRRLDARDFRPWIVAVLLVWLIHFKYYDWWGGWSFGYRPILDTVVVLVLLLIPAELTIRRHPRWFGLMLALSIAIQALAAFAFEPRAWNGRNLAVVLRYDSPEVETVSTDGPLACVRIDDSGVYAPFPQSIDLPINQWRMWSILGNQPAYMARYLRGLRELRRRELDRVAQSVPAGLAEAHANLGLAWQEDGDQARAEMEYQRAKAYDATEASTCQLEGELLARRGLFRESTAALVNALRQDGNAPRAWLALGKVSLELGEPLKSVTYFRMATLLDPKSKESAEWLSVAERRAGDSPPGSVQTP